MLSYLYRMLSGNVRDSDVLHTLYSVSVSEIDEASTIKSLDNVQGKIENMAAKNVDVQRT